MNQFVVVLVMGCHRFSTKLSVSIHHVGEYETMSTTFMALCIHFTNTSLPFSIYTPTYLYTHTESNLRHWCICNGSADINSVQLKNQYISLGVSFAFVVHMKPSGLIVRSSNCELCWCWFIMALCIWILLLTVLVCEVGGQSGVKTAQSSIRVLSCL